MSWWTLKGISEDRAQFRESWQAQGPVSCPNDGEPLSMDADGQLRCHFDGWTWHGWEKHY